MTRNCPDPNCGHESKSGRGVALHWARSKNHEGSLSDHYPDYDTSSTEQHSEATSEALKGNSLSEEHKRNISETLEGHSYLDDEHYEELAEINEGNDYASGYERTEAQKKGLEKGWYMDRSEEWNENISEALKGNSNGRRCTRYVVELGHQVDSSWEIDIAFLLKSLDLDYEREPSYEIWDGKIYSPDFQVGDVVIEVKGYADEDSKQKAEYFCENYPEKKYIVIGDEMECDTHIEWENREKLTEVV